MGQDSAAAPGGRTRDALLAQSPDHPWRLEGEKLRRCSALVFLLCADALR